MRGKDLKGNIKKAEDFITLWVKFHDLYKSAAKKETITQEEEHLFLETKSLITNKYKALKDALELRTSEDKEMMDVISHLLSLKGMTTMSDDALKRLENSWEHSYVFLNGISKDLKNQSQQFTEKRRLFDFLKKIFSNKATQVIVLILVIFIMMYLLNAMIRVLFK